MKIIFDFDGVLFHTQKLKEHFTRILEKEGVDPRMTELLYMKHRETGIPFSLKRFLWTVAVRTEVRSILEHRVYEDILKICSTLVNQELIEKVAFLGKENIFIVTNGDRDYQMEKISRSVGFHFADEVIVVPGSKKTEIENICKRFHDEPILFVEDQQKFLTDITLTQNLTPLLFGPQGVYDVEAFIIKHNHDRKRKQHKSK